MAKSYTVFSLHGEVKVTQDFANPVVRSLQLYATAVADYIAAVENSAALVIRDPDTHVYCASPTLARNVLAYSSRP